MAVINVRKARAGTDSAGHRWPADGAVIEVPVEHALTLTRIPDGGFSIVEVSSEELAAPVPAEMTEVAADKSETGKPPAKPRTAKTAEGRL